MFAKNAIAIAVLGLGFLTAPAMGSMKPAAASTAHLVTHKKLKHAAKHHHQRKSILKRHSKH